VPSITAIRSEIRSIQRSQSNPQTVVERFLKTSLAMRALDDVVAITTKQLVLSEKPSSLALPAGGNESGRVSGILYSGKHITCQLPARGCARASSSSFDRV